MSTAPDLSTLFSQLEGVQLDGTEDDEGQEGEAPPVVRTPK